MENTSRKIMVAKAEVKSLPIGISDYVRAQEEYYYVDKTLLIKEFLDQNAIGIFVYETKEIRKDLEYGYAQSVL